MKTRSLTPCCVRASAVLRSPIPAVVPVAWRQAACTALAFAALGLGGGAAPVFAQSGGQPVQPLAAPALVPAYLEEVPFITSPDNVTLEMLRVANVGAGDHLIDLGSGDGRIVILAARRFGATGLGVEIVPDLVERSLRNARDAGVADKVDFKVQDLFKTDLKPASVITMYLLPTVNMALRPTLLTLRPGTRVVSHDWDMEDWKPDQTTEVAVPNKVVGLAKSSKIHLWIVPARVGGLWCGAGPISGWSLRLDQAFQEVRGGLSRGGSTLPLQARMQGERLEAVGTAPMVLQARGDTLQVESAGGQSGLVRGASFQRAPGATCPA